MRLIDADAFDKMLIEAQAKCKKNGGNFRFGVLGNVRVNLALFPTVDHPEIVRCRDCKHVETCCRRRANDPNWFCADGEQREYVKPPTESATDWDGVECE
mgnify:CR=1 FL=1